MRWLVFAVVGLLACGGEDSSGGPNVPLQMFDSAFKDAECTHLTTCGLFRTKDECLQASLNNVPVLVGNVTNLTAAVLAGKAYYDGGKYAKCVAAIAAATCDRTDADSRGLPATCSHLFRGATPGGEACAFDEECVSEQCNLVCGELTCCQGTCIGDEPPLAPAPAAIGQSCATKACVATAFCDSTTQLCTALKTVNMPCSSNSQCDFGLGCAGGGQSPICKVLPGVTEPCLDFVCRDEGVYCSAGTCFELGLEGSHCNTGADCSPYLRCDNVTTTCAKYPAVGQSCASSFLCDASANVYCDSSTDLCTARKPTGSPCTSTNECATGFCDGVTNTCTAPQACF